MIRILRKEYKSKKDLNFLRKAIQGLALFQNEKKLMDIGNDKIFEQLKLEEYVKHHVVFKYGDPGTSYFIVLKGSLSLLVPIEMQKPEKPKFTLKDRIQKAITKRYVQNDQPDDDPQHEKHLQYFK